MDGKGVYHVSPNFHRDSDHKFASDPQVFDHFVRGTYLYQRYGAAKTRGGVMVFEYVKPPELVDGLELEVLLRKPLERSGG